MKKEYEVRIVVTKLYKVFVNAESEHEAEEHAERMLVDGELDECYSETSVEAEPTGYECDEEEED